MIDREKTIQEFKKKFDEMTYDERELYLKKMGFVFDDEIVKDQSPKMNHPTPRPKTKPLVSSFPKKSSIVKKDTSEERSLEMALFTSEG